MNPAAARRPWWMRVLAVMVSTCVTLLLVKVVDVVAVVWVKPLPLRDGLVFPPHSTGTYVTDEFSFSGDINNLGFRDRDFPLARTATPRIVAIGDSFTYGWGMPPEQSWPRQLEGDLLKAGCTVEVANLGCP